MIIIVNYPGYTNPATPASVQKYLWDQPWNLNRFYDVVSRGQFNYDNDYDNDGSYDIVYANLTTADLSSASFTSSCGAVQDAARGKLSNTTYPPSLYDTHVFMGPSGWACGYGVGAVGCGSYCWVAGTDHTDVTLWAHELGHNIGFHHSNDDNGTYLWEYSDYSCMMGSGVSSVAIRKGYNAVHLWRWGVINQASTTVISGPTTSFTGPLYSTYYEQEPFAASPIRLWQLGGPTGRLFLAYRSPRDTNFDRHSNFGVVNSHVTSLYVGRIMVYRMEPQGRVFNLSSGGTDSTNEGMATMIGFVDESATKSFTWEGETYAVRLWYHTDDYAMVGVGSQPSNPGLPPSSVPSEATLEANLFASPADSAAAVLTANVASMSGTSTTSATTNTFDLFRTASSSTNKTVFFRLPIRVPAATRVLEATLVLEASWGGNSASTSDNVLPVVVSVGDYDNYTSTLTGNLLNLAWSTATAVGNVHGPLVRNQEVEIPVQTLVQELVSRSNWSPGNWAVFKLSSAGDPDFFSFEATGANRRVFAGPRLRIRYAPYDELVCAAATTLEELVDCIQNQMGPYVQPEASQVIDWRDAVSSMLGGSCHFPLGASIKGLLQLREFRDASNLETYCVLMEVRDENVDGFVDKGFGTVIVYPRAQRELAHQAPHPVTDSATAAQAIGVFKATKSRVFVLSGTLRNRTGISSSCQTSYDEADVAHNDDNCFHATTQALDTFYGPLSWNVIQWHGMAADTCAGVDVFLSHGRDSVPLATDKISQLRDAILQVHPSSWSVALPGSGACTLVATANVQGRLLNGVAPASVCGTAASTYSGKFIHIEQDPGFRNASDWSAAVASTFPVPLPPPPALEAASTLLTWSDSSLASEWNVWSATTSSSGPWSLAAIRNNPSYAPTLSAGASVWWRVSALGPGGESPPSNVVLLRTAPRPPVVTSTDSLEKAVRLNLSFDNVTQNVDKITVYSCGPIQGCWYVHNFYPPWTNPKSVTITGRQNYEELQFLVTSFNGDKGEDIWSQPVSYGRALPCLYTLTPPRLLAAGSAQNASFSVSLVSGSGCLSWPTESLTWCSISSGSGSSPVTFNISSTTGSRSGNITVGSVSVFPIYQNCAWTLTPSSVQLSTAAQNVTITIATACAVDPVSNQPWVSAISWSQTRLVIEVTGNAAESRVGSVLIGNATFAITQAGAVTSPPTTGAPTTAAPTTLATTNAPTTPPPDGICNGAETCANMPQDCITTVVGDRCGDGICQTSSGEDCLNCPIDCAGKTNGPANGRYCCGLNATCTDSRCTANGYQCTVVSNPSTQYCCGSGICDPTETAISCPRDCTGVTSAPTTASPTSAPTTAAPTTGCGASGSQCSVHGNCCSNKCRGGQCT